MRVLGVDPGTVAAGWGVVEEHGQRRRYIDGGVIRARGALAARLATLHAALVGVIDRLQPDVLAIEQAFVATNVQSALRLGEARGVALLAASQRGLSVCEYAPASVKVAASGYGRAAKQQMQTMVARLLDLPAEPPSDLADALAVALCHLQSYRLRSEVDDALAAGSRRRRLRFSIADVQRVARGAK